MPLNSLTLIPATPMVLIKHSKFIELMYTGLFFLWEFLKFFCTHYVWRLFYSFLICCVMFEVPLVSRKSNNKTFIRYLRGRYWIDIRYDISDHFNFSHGTKVVGILAAEANNSQCIVGVAHQSTVIGEHNCCFINIRVHQFSLNQWKSHF